MSALTEAEIFDCLRTNLALAIEHCGDLAELPAQGPTYRKLINELKLCEGCCRQAAYWREDARWLQYGLIIEASHQKAGGWLRAKQPRRLYTALASFLVQVQRHLTELRTARTGRIGAILPKPMAAPHRDHRPVQVLLPRPAAVTPGGVYLPA